MVLTQDRKVLVDVQVVETEPSVVYTEYEKQSLEQKKKQTIPHRWLK